MYDSIHGVVNADVSPFHTTGVSDQQLAEMASDLADGIRNEAAIDDTDLEAMEAAALDIDPAECQSGPLGCKFCPRCGDGFGCCTIKRDPEDRERWICSGGCDHAGHHHRIRPTPENKSLSDPTEALGQIDPARADVLYRASAAAWGQNVFEVAKDGRVLLRKGYTPICGGEALELGKIVGEFIYDEYAQVSDAERKIGITVKQDGQFFNAFLTYPDGQRVTVPGYYTTADDAHSCGTELIAARRSTIHHEALAQAAKCAAPEGSEAA